MKKYIAAFALSTLVSLPAMASSLEYGMWDQSASGGIGGTVTQTFPTTKSQQNILAGEIGIPFFMDFKFSNASMYVANGADYMNINQTNLIFFMKPSDNYITIKAGVGATLYMIDANVGGTPFSAPAPDAIGYLGASFNPVDSLSVGMDYTKGFLLGSSMTDYYVSYKVLGGIGVKAGRRAQSMNFTQGADSINFKGAGNYINVFLKF